LAGSDLHDVFWIFLKTLEKLLKILSNFSALEGRSQTPFLNTEF